MKSSSVWKLLGLAGVVGVAASGAVVARSERARRAYTPDEVREQLHRRLAVATTTAHSQPEAPPPPPPSRGERFRRRVRDALPLPSRRSRRRS